MSNSLAPFWPAAAIVIASMGEKDAYPILPSSIVVEKTGSDIRNVNLYK